MIRLETVTFTYPGAREPALREVSLELGAGELALVVGPSGGGKSTLLRCLNGLVPHFTGGRLRGRIEVAGRSPPRDGPVTMSELVGIVSQDPEAQMVVDRVEDEVAFALEQRAVPRPEMLARVERALSLVGLLRLRDRAVETLSGGERQRVAIAAALALEPRVLVLDEPTSQLDPDGAAEVLASVVALRDRLGLTIVLAEHRLERVLHLADRLLHVAGGIVTSGAPRDLFGRLELAALAPPIVRLGLARRWEPLPLSVEQARPFASASATHVPSAVSPARASLPALSAAALTYHHPGSQNGIHAVDLDLAAGEIVALSGPNGAGKTTLLRCLVGLLQVSRGTISLQGHDVTAVPTADRCRNIGYLPQAPDDLLFAETVSDELLVTLRNHRLPSADSDDLLHQLGLSDVRDSYPRDLSTGQRQRVALAAIAVTLPPVLLFDEPTRGLDAATKASLSALLQMWRDRGTAILLVTHDAELAFTLADRFLHLDQGRLTPAQPPRTQLSELSGQ